MYAYTQWKCNILRMPFYMICFWQLSSDIKGACKFWGEPSKVLNTFLFSSVYVLP